MLSTRQKIQKLFSQSEDWTVVQLTKELNVSKQLIHRILNDFIADGTLIKLGLPPKTVYRSLLYASLVQEEALLPLDAPKHKDADFLQAHFLLITETGEYLEGLNGFTIWCQKRDLPLEKTIKEFKETRKKYAAFYNVNGLVNGIEKIKTTKGFDAIYIDQLYYLDFYAIERFGKTKLGAILHFAKQGQNKFLMHILLDAIKKQVFEFIKNHKIDAVGFVPPTIKRELQLMHFIQHGLELKLPIVQIQKISGRIAVPQKSLNKIDERINNANKTFTIPELNRYNKILLIDDAVGSGATLNQIARKIKEKKIAKHIDAIALVGSFKGFDVITDV
jgi:hypothetical protein